jgi:hypothetical protein
MKRQSRNIFIYTENKLMVAGKRLGEEGEGIKKYKLIVTD